MLYKGKNKELINLFKKSGLNKSEFSKKIGIKKQNLNNILGNKNRLNEKTYNRYLNNFNQNKI